MRPTFTRKRSNVSQDSFRDVMGAGKWWAAQCLSIILQLIWTGNGTHVKKQKQGALKCSGCVQPQFCCYATAIRAGRDGDADHVNPLLTSCLILVSAFLVCVRVRSLVHSISKVSCTVSPLSFNFQVYFSALSVFLDWDSKACLFSPGLSCAACACLTVFSLWCQWGYKGEPWCSQLLLCCRASVVMWNCLTLPFVRVTERSTSF